MASKLSIELPRAHIADEKVHILAKVFVGLGALFFLTWPVSMFGR